MRYIVLVLTLATAFIFYKAYSDYYSNKSFATGIVTVEKADGSKVEINVKIADNPQTQQHGLMNVKEMKESDGMIFIFEAEENKKMWMENTYIPLDMMFVNSSKVIFNFKENATPLSREIIYSQGPALYVIEVNGGFIKQNNIQAGDKIEFQAK